MLCVVASHCTGAITSIHASGSAVIDTIAPPPNQRLCILLCVHHLLSFVSSSSLLIIHSSSPWLQFRSCNITRRWNENKFYPRSSGSFIDIVSYCVSLFIDLPLLVFSFLFCVVYSRENLQMHIWTGNTVGDTIQILDALPILDSLLVSGQTWIAG